MVSSVIAKLLDDFFDQNPISQVALVVMSDGRAERITDLSGNARNHKNRLDERLAQGTAGGKGAASLRSQALLLPLTHDARLPRGTLGPIAPHLGPSCTRPQRGIPPPPYPSSGRLVVGASSIALPVSQPGDT